MPATHTSASTLDSPFSLGASAAPPWPVGGRLVPDAVRVRDTRGGGFSRIYGNVRTKGTPNFPTYARVRLYREIDGLCLAEQWSDAATGAYEFTGLDQTLRFTVIAYHPSHTLLAVVSDYLLPEATA